MRSAACCHHCIIPSLFFLTKDARVLKKKGITRSAAAEEEDMEKYKIRFNMKLVQNPI